MKICVLGLGYIGLPTSAIFALSGHQVFGVDINKKIAEAINEGKILIEEPGLSDIVEKVVKSNNLKAGYEPQKADVFIICVGTPLKNDNTANMYFVRKALRMILPYIKKGNTVILESTSPPGTIDDMVVPYLSKSGLNPDTDLYIAYSPERVLPGKILHELIHNDRIIGGYNDKSSEKVKEIYTSFVKGEIYLTDSKTAEMCKLMENTYRDVNIALANELAKICMKKGVDVWKAINFANKHPRVNIHTPGPGVGGHCIAVDPWFILQDVIKSPNIITLSRRTNDNMPDFVYKNSKKILKKNKGIKKVVILGASYKPDIDDTRESPSIKLTQIFLQDVHFNAVITDPYAKPDDAVIIEKYESGTFLDTAKDADLIILAVAHTVFKDIDWDNVKKVMRNANVYDTKCFLDEKALTDKGFKYYLHGRG